MNERQIYIDWIRIFLIFSVFLFHIGMIFNGWSWHVKNDAQFALLNRPMAFLHAWRMPLLFLVSGAGTRFALGFRSTKQFISERKKRLLIPFAAGIFILVPVQVYIEKLDQYASLLDFYMHFFDGIYPEGNFSWHHLWFIIYLFFISLMFVPFIAFYRSSYYRLFENRLERLAKRKAGLLVLALPLLISQLILRPWFPEETHALFNDWAFLCLDFIYFLYGFILLGNPELVKAIAKHRRVNLGVTLITTGAMYSLPDIFQSVSVGHSVYTLLSILMSWTISLTILGYAKKYLNTDMPIRKPLNAAIYPFYLLHQPVIIVVAYFVTGSGLSVSLKAALITGISLIIISAVYQFFIFRNNILRVIFGMKRKEKSQPTRVNNLPYQKTTKQSASW